MGGFFSALLIGGIFAGAGQRRGVVAGTLLGVANAVLLLSVQMLTRRPTNDLVLYCQPILHAFLGAAGGALGRTIWRPLPWRELSNRSSSLWVSRRPVRNCTTKRTRATTKNAQIICPM